MDANNGALSKPSNHNLLDDSNKFVGVDNLGWDSNNMPPPPKVKKLVLLYHVPVKRAVLALGA